MSKNPYQILHLDEDAGYDQIRQRYKHLTKNLHPDKQPLQNYQMAKKHFEQIDGAYKAISSPLRRFVYKQFGQFALKMIDDFPMDFTQFQKQVLTPNEENRLRQLIIYMLYEHHASQEAEKSKVINKTVLNVTRTLDLNKSNAKRPLNRRSRIPQLENCVFEYQLNLPEFKGFSNSFAVSHSASNIKSDPNSNLTFNFSSVRRFQEVYMLAALASVNQDDANIDFTVERVFWGNTNIRFTPISLTNTRLNNPKIGFQRGFGKFNAAGMTDFNSISFELNEPANKRISKSIKLFLQRGSVSLVPRVQYELTSNIRLFVQVTLSVQSLNGGNELAVRPNFQYGYKLKLAEQFRIELASNFGAQNYFQITFISPKFRVALPMLSELTSGTDTVTFEFYKLLAFVGTYAFLTSIQRLRIRNKIYQQKLKRQQLSRLNEQKHELNKMNSFNEITVKEIKEKELKYKGLVILKAFLGKSQKIQAITTLLKNLKLEADANLIEGYEDAIQGLIAGNVIKFNEIEDEVIEVTDLIQMSVIGGQLLKFNLSNLLKFNPCYNENEMPILTLIYFERGEIKFLQKAAAGELNLGGLKERYEKMNPFALLKRFSNYLIDLF